MCSLYRLVCQDQRQDFKENKVRHLGIKIDCVPVRYQRQDFKENKVTYCMVVVVCCTRQMSRQDFKENKDLIESKLVCG